MLRFALLVLVVINMGYFAWSHGWMRSLGWAPSSQAEPQRLHQQVRPEALVLPPVAKAPSVAAATSVAAPVATAAPAQSMAPTPPAAAVAEPEALVLAQAAAEASPAPVPAPTQPTVAPEPAPPPGMCLQAGSFDEAQAHVLRAALRKQGMDNSQWEMQPSTISGRWMVYIGKLQGAALDQRRSELRARNIDVDRAGGALDPGLSLGRFSSEEAATRALTQVLRQGVRGARVVQERPSATVYTLRLPNASAALRLQTQGLQAALAGKPLQPCSSGN